ncbi:MAG: HEAT repeat domain-containing protein [Planctomycetota bacterium]
MRQLSRCILCLALLTCPARAADIPAEVRNAAQELKKYEVAQPRTPLAVVEKYAWQASSDPEQRAALAELLAATLKDAQTRDARTTLCQLLAWAGTDAQVPVLAEMLSDPERGEMARYALEVRNSPAADQALRTALPRLSGTLLVEVIYSLGSRRDREAVAALIGLLKSDDAKAAPAALWSLGMIASKEAAAALEKEQGPAADHARLTCAQRIARDSDAATAADLCRPMFGADRSAAMRVAALTQLTALAPEGLLELLRTALDDQERAVRDTALRLLARTKDPSATGILLERLKKSDPPVQARLLDVLAERRDKAARTAVEELAEHSTDENVRAAALRALGSVGSADSLKLLVEAAAKPKSPASAAAQEALAELVDENADKLVLAGLGAGPAQMRVGMMRAAALRGCVEAVPALLAAVRDVDQTVALAACQALKQLGQSDNYPALVKLLAEVQTPAVRDELASVATVVGRRVGDPKERLAPIAALLQQGGVAGESGSGLMRVLAAIGGAPALALVKTWLDSPDAPVRDAAVRTLALWPDASAMEVLLQTAEKSNEPVHRALALRGFFRLAVSTPPSVQFLARAKDLAHTTAEKQQFLAALAEVPAVTALDAAVQLLPDHEVAREAALAALKIAEALKAELARKHDAQRAKQLDAALEKLLGALNDSDMEKKVKALQAAIRKVEEGRGK